MKKILATLALIAASYMVSAYNIEIKATENGTYVCDPKVDPTCSDYVGSFEIKFNETVALACNPKVNPNCND